MRGVEQREPRARDVVLDVLVRLRWRRRIVLGGDDEGGRFDLRQQLAVVHVAHRLAAGDIAFERRRGEHLLQYATASGERSRNPLVNQRSMFAGANAGMPFSRTSLRRSFHALLSAK